MMSLERTSQCYLSCSIYPSQQEPGTVQIPIGNNTGSLPDLTSFHFPPPLPTPLDQEDPSSSPYSTVSVALLSALSYFVTKLRLIVCHFLVAFCYLYKRCVQCIYGEISVIEVVHEYPVWRFPP